MMIFGHFLKKTHLFSLGLFSVNTAYGTITLICLLIFKSIPLCHYIGVRNLYSSNNLQAKISAYIILPPKLIT